MTELSRSEISERLSRLAVDLDRFPSGAPCPWPLARVFNDLVKLVKRDLVDDPVVRPMRLLEEGSEEGGTLLSNVAVGTVRALIGQVVIAYDDEVRRAPPVTEPDAAPETKAPKRATPKKAAPSTSRAA